MTEETRCRACGETELRPVLDLGRMPLANALLDEGDLGETERRYPLEVVFCPGCSLVQITETVPPEELFREYVYFSSYSDTMVDHARELVDRLVEERDLGPDGFVVEVASNDGYLLQFYKERGVQVLGIEPARNVARVAEEERGIPTIPEFFDEALAAKVAASEGRADVVHLHNVLAHVADLDGVLAGIRALMAQDGVTVVEVPYVGDLVDHVEFDTIYHEHLCYFSLTALTALFQAAGLAVIDVERIPLHGGSLQVLVAHAGTPPSDRVAELLEEEADRGMDRYAYYRDFGGKVQSLRDELLSLLAGLGAEDPALAGYGAAAKATVLLNYLGVGPDTIRYVVDRNPVKQGRYLPGVRIPIRSPEVLVEEMPDAVLVLAWNFADEIMEQQAAYREAGGTFVVPLPTPRIVEP